MNKLCKILSVIAVIAIVIVTSISVRAYTNDDVIDYITGEHEVNGRTLKLNQKSAVRLKLYFEENPVTDDQPNEIIAKLDEARNKLSAAGVSTATEVKEYDTINNATLEADVVALIKEAGAIAGLDIEVDTVNEIVTIKDRDGNNVISPTDYLDLFGSNTPENPDDPNKPVNPDDPDDPNTPVNPDDPNTPVDPDKPNKPENPDDPNAPVDPDKPNKPVNPDDSNTPVDSNKPNKPDNKPSNSNSNNTNNSNNNTTNNANTNKTTNKVVNQSSAKKLVYTGNDYSFIIKTIVAIVAVAITGVVIRKHAK